MRRPCFCKNKLNAYFTVELAMIFPIVLLVIVTIIHLAFMMYGRTIMAQDSYILGLRGAILSKDDPAAYTNSSLDAYIGNYYLGNEKPKSSQINVDSKDKVIKVVLSSKTYHGGTKFENINPFINWIYNQGFEVSYERPVEKIRLFKRVYDIGKIGVSKIKEN